MDEFRSVPKFPQPGAQPPALPRRRVLKAGLAGAPVLATLASRPVFAGQCLGVSAYGSLGGSLVPTASVCSGYSPTTWSKTKPWPTPFYATSAGGTTATQFHSLTTGLQGNLYSGSTMMQVLKMTNSSDMQTLARYVSAGLLNAQMGLTPVLDCDTVRAMWNDCVAGNSFQPTAGVSWGPAEVVQYLKTTISS